MGLECGYAKYVTSYALGSREHSISGFMHTVFLFVVFHPNLRQIRDSLPM